MSMAKFSELLPELIESFMKRLTCIDDCVRAAAACQSWHSAFAATRKRPHFSPWLMQTNDDTDAENLRTFSCLSSNREFTFELADIHGRRCWGTPFGWMVSLDPDLHLHLINPVSGVQLALPPQSTFPIQFPEECPRRWLHKICAARFALSSNPSIQNQSCIVTAVYFPEGRLCFAKPGDKAWTPIETTLCWYEDAIYLNGLVYAIDRLKGFLTVCDINTPHPKGTLIEAAPPLDQIYHQFYLVDMSGELHLVVRYSDYVVDQLNSMDNYYITAYFCVYKFDFHKESWIEVDDLKDHALFIGNNSSFVISTNDQPDIKPNAIYYTDDGVEHFHTNFCDMMVYDYTEDSSELFYMGPNMTSVFSRPVFIIPGL